MAGSMCSASVLCLLEAHKFSSSGQFPKSHFTLSHCCNMGSSHFCSVSLWVTCLSCWHTYKLPSWYTLGAAPYRAHRSAFAIMNIRAEAIRGCYAPTPNVDCIPEGFCYLVCNEEGPIPLSRVNKGVWRLCLESLEVLRRTLESLQACVNCHQDFWNCFSPWTILLYINHLQKYIFKIIT